MEIVEKQVDKAYQILQRYEHKARVGQMSKKEAQELAKKEISKLRFNKSEYFFIFNSKLVMVMHPVRPDFEGKDLSNLKDAAGNYILRACQNAANNGTGFSTYYWPMPGLSYPVEKIVYSKLFKPWSWIIATSIYVKASENLIGQEQFILAVSLIELYKKQVGVYPNKLPDLARFGAWVNVRTANFRYQKVSGGYNLFLHVEEEYLQNVALPMELKTGLGLVNTNVKFSHSSADGNQ